MKILIVDDSADIRSMLSTYFQVVGYQVVEATNGLRAVEVAKKEYIDLILMDLYMPVMDGFAATQAIRQKPRTQSIPIIAISAYLDHSSKERALKAGCNAVIDKTAHPNIIEALVDKYLMVC
jgi:CheY-like chemotaxis protein